MNLYDDRYDIYSYIGKVPQIKGEGISLTISLHPLAHRNLQKEIWEMGDKVLPLEYTDEFNLQMNKITFNFL